MAFIGENTLEKHLCLQKPVGSNSMMGVAYTNQNVRTATGVTWPNWSIIQNKI
jgi:hypothetical protein